MLEKTIEKNLSSKTVKQLKPQHSIMDCYGTVKLHKQGAPLRPIATGYKSLTAGADQFLTKTFNTLLNDKNTQLTAQKASKVKLTAKMFHLMPKNIL